MRVMTKEQMVPNLIPVPAQGWDAFMPPVDGDEDASLVLEARSALRQAEVVIRAQEERIRQLEAMALTDELTGLANRRGFSIAFDRELSLARRDANHGGILVMIDLDGFKGINDTFGHQAGDAYLCKTAQVLTNSLRASDTVARLGGDEFALLLTHLDEKTGARRMARLEQAFGRHALVMHERIPLRASFGFAPYAGNDRAEEIIAAADAGLYAHKARNKKFLAAPVASGANA